MSKNPPYTRLPKGITEFFALRMPQRFSVKAAIIFGFLVLLLSLLSSMKKTSYSTDVAIESFQPAPGVIRLSVRANGTIWAEGQRSVYAQVTGSISEIPAENAAQVEADQVLARISDDQYRNSLDAARSRLAGAEAEAAAVIARIAQAKRKLRRSERLYAADLIPRQEKEEARISLQEFETRHVVEKTRVAQATTDLAQAQRNLDQCTLRSPISGIILNTEARVGMQVQPSGVPLFTVAPSLDNLEIRVSVTESDIGKVKAGQMASFYVQAYPDQKFSGEVKTIHRGGVQRDGVSYFSVLVATNNPDHKLLPGMSTEVIIDAGERHVERQIPLRALLYSPATKIIDRWQETLNGIRQKGQTQVWVVDDSGEIQPVGIELGIQDQEHLELVGNWSYGKETKVLYRP